MVELVALQALIALVSVGLLVVTLVALSRVSGTPGTSSDASAKRGSSAGDHSVSSASRRLQGPTAGQLDVAMPIP